MFWVTVITGIVILSLAIIHGPKATSKDLNERRKFHLIWQVGILVIMIERLIYRLFD